MLITTVQTLSVFCCVGIALALLPSLYAGVLFAWHPLFMVVGYLGFMTEGILAAYKFRNLDGGPRVLAIQNHAWIQVASTLSVALGFGAIYRNKALKGKVHYTSLHGKVGLITLALTLAAPLLGAGSFRKLGIVTRFPEQWQPRIKWLHRMLAVLTWVLALLTMQLDLPHPAVLEGLPCRLWQGGVAVLCVAMLAMLRMRTGKPTSLPTTISRTRLNSFSGLTFSSTKAR